MLHQEACGYCRMLPPPGELPFALRLMPAGTVRPWTGPEKPACRAPSRASQPGAFGRFHRWYELIRRYPNDPCGGPGSWQC